ncbi:MAG: hypothetical protein U0264_05915 [Candidatus Kapaibacterium sp.]
MPYGKLIHDYLDGTLDSSSEDILFAELSVNQDVRREFQTQTRLNAAVQKDMSRTTTPVEATQAVFASLGFALPQADTDTPPVPLPIPPAAAGDSGMWPKILYTALFSSALTALFFLWWSPRETDTHLLMAEILKRPQPATRPLTSEITDRNALTMVEIPAAPARNAVREPRVIASEVYNSGENSSHAPATEVGDAPAVLTMSAAYIQPSSPMVQNIAPQNSSPLYATSFSSAESIVPNELLGLTVQTNGISQLRSLPDFTDTPASLPVLSNLSASVLYALSEHHALGLAGGREVFHQDFTRENGGQTFAYRQSPSLWWYGVAYRYSLGDVGIKGVNPFAQGFIGWAQNGPIGKISTGIRYTPEERISFVLAAEGSLLVYPVGSTYFQTQKLGITYGMSINF